MRTRISCKNTRPRRRRWPWVLAALVLGVFLGWLSGSLHPFMFGSGIRRFLGCVFLLSATLLSNEIVLHWHERQRLLANVWLALATTQLQLADFWSERTVRVFVVLAGSSWLALLLLSKQDRKWAAVCVWFFGASLASAVLSASGT